MEVRLYYHQGGFPNPQLKELSPVEYPIDLEKHPLEIEQALTKLLAEVRSENPHPHLPMHVFAVVGIGDHAQIIGAEVVPDVPGLKPQMRYLKQSASHQIADA